MRVLEGFRYGFERLWERVIGLADRAGGLLYVLAIKGDFKRHQVALDSSYVADFIMLRVLFPM